MRMVTARGGAFPDHYGQNYLDSEMDLLYQGEQESDYIGIKPILFAHGKYVSLKYLIKEKIQNVCY